MVYIVDRRVRQFRLDIRRYLRLRRNQRRLVFGFMGLIILALFFGLVFSLDRTSELKYQNQVQRQNFIKTRQSLQNRLESVEKQKADTDAQLQQKAADEANLKAQIDDLNKQLQAKKEQSIASRVINTVIGTQVAYAATTVAGCGDNQYANFIYMHESGCSLYNPNSASGACGLGQAYPCSKLMAVCPNMDYACENQFFTNYCLGISGGAGWAACYQIWISKGWW